MSRQKNFGLTHKMTKRHIQWEDRKMHVRTAVETLSNSTANSMEFLLKNNVEEFIDAEPTIKFIRIADKVWDVMNTQKVINGNSNIFKNALNSNNKNEVLSFLKEAKEYFLSLMVEDPKTKKKFPIVESTSKTGFRGIVVNIISLTEMYSELVENNKWMAFLPIYRLSQDHLEMFFGKVRSMNGSNDNPTASQFISAYRKLLFNADVQPSNYCNVRAISSSNCLTIPSSSQRSSQRKNTESFFNGLFESMALPSEFDQELRELREYFEWDELSNGRHLEEAQIDYGIVFTANIVEQRLINCKQVHCNDCVRVLNDNEKIPAESCVSVSDSRPCKSTYEICRFADMALKTYINKGEAMKLRVYSDVLNNISTDDIFPSFYSPPHDIEHKRFLIKYIIDEYVNKKCAYVAKQHTLNLQKKYLRNKLRKQYHNEHQ